jgi:acetyl esterase/lipase
MRSTVSFLLFILFLAIAGAAEKRDEIRLWPKTAPGEKDKLGAEQDMTKPNEGLVAGKRVIRLGNVSDPTLSYYPAPAGNDTGCAVLVCPGGAYHILAMDLEGTEVCEWLNSIGVTAILLKYRVPARKDQQRYAAPLQDAQRALSLVRSRASEGKMKHLGILGFSAGGHLAAVTSSQYDKRTYETIDEADRQSCRPDFTVLIYPAYLTDKNEPTKLAPELTITPRTPPTFLLQTQDDGVGVWNAMGYGLSLERAKVPFEMHIYPKGGHGYGLRPTERPVTLWPKQVEVWMKQLGVLGAK